MAALLAAARSGEPRLQRGHSQTPLLSLCWLSFAAACRTTVRDAEAPSAMLPSAQAAAAKPARPAFKVVVPTAPPAKPACAPAPAPAAPAAEPSAVDEPTCDGCAASDGR